VPDKFFIPKATPNDSADVADFHILSVGRLSGEKQQSLLIDAIANSRHREKIQLQLVGAGPNEVELNTQITKAGINATVETVSDAELLLRYQLADLFVHCGMIELEGMSVAEAMAASNAVVVSDSEASAAGMFAISESAKFKSGDVNDLTEKLDYWIENPDARIEAGKLNRNFIQGYRHEACIEKLIGLYARFSGEG
jgi:glycosyltransferase involved in cell wall biosynthesis